MAPRTILLKLSGEALIGEKNFGIDTDVLEYLSKEISDVKDKFSDLRIAMVVGGGNIWRGADYEKLGMDRSVADSAGMLATMTTETTTS